MSAKDRASVAEHRWRWRPRAWRRGLPLVLAAVLAGCASSEPLYHSGATATLPEGGATLVPPGQAQVQLAAVDAGGIVAVRRRVVAGLLHEDVIVGNRTALPRENRLSLRTPMTSGTGVGARPAIIPRVTEESLAARSAVEFPGRPIMAPVAFRQNGLGSYAYVASRYPDGTTCVLAWQAVEVSGFDDRGRRTALEWRVCDPSADAIALLAPFERFTLRG